MPSDPERPFDHDTLKLRAVFVPDHAKDKVSASDISGSLGYDAVKIPAVFVAKGEQPPGYPYEHFGEAVFRPDAEDGGEGDNAASSSASSQSSGAAPQDAPAGPALPPTRFRFGAALSGSTPEAGQPPNPAVAGGWNDPAAGGIAMWRSLANPGSLWRQSSAAPGAKGSPPAAASGTEDVPAAPAQSQPDQAERRRPNGDGQNDLPNGTE